MPPPVPRKLTQEFNIVSNEDTLVRSPNAGSSNTVSNITKLFVKIKLRLTFEKKMYSIVTGCSDSKAKLYKANCTQACCQKIQF